jgi:hypothetical protein
MLKLIRRTIGIDFIVITRQVLLSYEPITDILKNALNSQCSVKYGYSEVAIKGNGPHMDIFVHIAGERYSLSAGAFSWVVVTVTNHHSLIPVTLFVNHRTKKIRLLGEEI